MPSQSDFFKRLVVDGGKSFGNVSTDKQLLAASLELTVNETSELLFAMNDPEFMYLKSFGEKGPLGKSAQYDDLLLSCSGYTCEAGQIGHGLTTLRFRPRGIERSRNIKGALSREGISPSQFVIDGAANCGMRCVAQESPVRPSISRDVENAEEGGQQEEANEWTTLNRLAAEEGFLIFEVKNVLYFGSPKWLFDTQPQHTIGYGMSVTDDQFRMIEAPTINVAEAAIADDITFTIPIEQAGKILPGHSIHIKGIPTIDKRFLVVRVTYPLAGAGYLEIIAREPWKIEKQDTPEQKAAKEAARNAAKAQSSGGGGGGSGVNFGPGGAGAAHYAKEVIAAAKEKNLGQEGARNGIATVLVETNMKMYANSKVPRSLTFPHDAVGSDGTSCGLFQQQQNGGWGTLEENMNARASAHLFYNAMMRFNWRGMDPGAACQKVQQSAFPGKYAQRMGEATNIVNQYW